MFIIAILMQNVFGTSVGKSGTILLEEENVSLLNNQTYYYSITFEEELNYISFAFNEEVEFFIFHGIIDMNSNISEIEDEAIYHEQETEGFGYGINEKGPFTVVIITPNEDNIKTSFIFREYSTADENNMAINLIGGYVLKASFIPIGLYIILVFILPYLKKKINGKKQIDKELQISNNRHVEQEQVLKYDILNQQSTVEENFNRKETIISANSDNRIEDRNKFHCPRCHATSLLSNNPLFCSKCGYAFPVGRNKEILIDQNNYAVFTSPTPQIPHTQISPLNHNSIGYQQNRPRPTLGYPVSYPQTYPQMGYKPIKKQRTWNVWAGFLVPLITYIGIILLSLIPALFLIADGNSTLTPVITFIIGSFSLFFFAIPLWWVNRYYPGKLTLRQRLDVLGLPLEKYKKPELIREILLGTLLGLVMVFIAFGFQIVGSLLIQWIYGVDIMNFMDGINFEDFDLTSPGKFWELLLFVLQMLLFVGFSEEIMFRGFVQRSFESKMNKPAALLLTAVYFGLFHIYIFIVYPPIFLFFLIVYLGVSIFLGVVRNWRKDLWAVGAAHIMYNCIQTIIIYFIFL